jgi:4,5-dihydroxyphthalate decarboxylase
LARRPLRIACWNYDRVAAIGDGRVAIEGCDAVFEAVSPHNFYFRASDAPPYDVIEQSFSSYLAARSREATPYTAIPVYPSRMFRHSAIYVRTDRVARPEDLRGGRVGVPFYAITAALTARGVLLDEYGIEPNDLCWIDGPLEHGDPALGARVEPPAGVRLEHLARGSLSQLLADGDIDALISAAEPSCVREGAPNVGRLFPDYRSVERAYFARTGIFPIMHVLSVRTDLCAADSTLAARVYSAFCAAKDLCMAALDGGGGAVMATLPWMIAELESTVALMGPDFWPYGVDANRATLAAMTRWSNEQGLSARRLDLEELFEPTTLDGMALPKGPHEERHRLGHGARHQNAHTA